VIFFLLNLITVKRERKEKKKNFPWFPLFKLLLLNQSLFRDATCDRYPTNLKWPKYKAQKKENIF